MNRMLAAVCAATLLCGSLTACSMNTTKKSNTPTTNRTSYTATKHQSKHPDGADQDRASYNKMLSNQGRYAGTSDGQYTAYSNGVVSRRGANRSLMENGKDIGKNIVDGTRSMIDNVNQTVHDLGGIPRADDMPYD